MKADLHTHTTSSDGLYSPEELVALAAHHRITLLAITDHDTFDGAEQIMAAKLMAAKKNAAKPPMQMLMGVELSLRDMHGLHLLGYGRNMDTPLHRKVKELAEMRVSRAERMVQKLASLGYPLSMEWISAEVHGSIGRPHIARAMVEAGYVADVAEAFDRFIGDGGPAYVGGERLSMAEALPLMHESGFVPVIAHPMELEKPDAAIRYLLGQWQEQGLMGVEVYHPSAGRNMAQLDRMARRMGFLITGGSDFHGDSGRHGMLGCTAAMWTNAEKDVERLMEAME